LSIPAQAKLGETVPQLVKRFGKSYTIEPVQIGEKYKFRSENVSVDSIVANGVSVAETYFSDHPLTASGEPPNDIVRAVLRTNVPKARWLEIEATPFEADYALRSSENEYIAVLRYTGPQPKDSVWTMTVGLAKVVGSMSTATPSPPNPVTTPLPTPAPTPPVSAAPVIIASPQPAPHVDFSPVQLDPVQIATYLGCLASVIICVLKGRWALSIIGIVSSILIYFGPLITGNYVLNLLSPFEFAPYWGALRLAHPTSYWAFWFYRNKRPKYYRAVERFGLKEESSALIGKELPAERKIKATPKREPDQEPRSLKKLSIFSTQFNSKNTGSMTDKLLDNQSENQRIEVAAKQNDSPSPEQPPASTNALTNDDVRTVRRYARAVVWNTVLSDRHQPADVEKPPGILESGNINLSTYPISKAKPDGSFDHVRAIYIRHHKWLDVGFDATAFVHEITSGVHHMARGFVDFATWSERLLKELGERVRPYLRGVHKYSWLVYTRADRRHRHVADLERKRDKLVSHVNATQDSAAVDALYKVSDQIMDAMYAAEMSGAELGGSEDPDLLHDTEWIRLKIELEKAKQDFEVLCENLRLANHPIPPPGKPVVLIPTVTPEGKELTNEEAIERYFETGQHLGVFSNRAWADAYLHNISEALKERNSARL
jgi:hypothetical protein